MNLIIGCGYRKTVGISFRSSMTWRAATHAHQVCVIASIGRPIVTVSAVTGIGVRRIMMNGASPVGRGVMTDRTCARPYSTYGRSITVHSGFSRKVRIMAHHAIIIMDRSCDVSIGQVVMTGRYTTGALACCIPGKIRCRMAIMRSR